MTLSRPVAPTLFLTLLLSTASAHAAQTWVADFMDAPAALDRMLPEGTLPSDLGLASIEASRRAICRVSTTP